MTVPRNAVFNSELSTIRAIPVPRAVSTQATRASPQFIISICTTRQGMCSVLKKNAALTMALVLFPVVSLDVMDVLCVDISLACVVYSTVYETPHLSSLGCDHIGGGFGPCWKQRSDAPYPHCEKLKNAECEATDGVGKFLSQSELCWFPAVDLDIKINQQLKKKYCRVFNFQFSRERKLLQLSNALQ